MWRGPIFRVFVLCVALAGCQFVDLASDNKERKKLSAIRGRIVQEKPTDNPIVVTLCSKQHELINAKVIDTKEFLFYAPEGTYFVFAYEDTNGDFLYRSDDLVGCHSDQTPIVLRAGAERTGIRIK